MGNNGAGRKGMSTCKLASRLMFISVFILLLSVVSVLLNLLFYILTGPPTGKLAFVLGAERAPGVVDALNNSRIFNAVIRIDDDRMLSRLCGNIEKSVHTPYPERIGDACASKAVVVVTDGKLGAAVMFLGSEGEITQRVIEILTFERFDGGYIDIYDADKQLGYTKGYELRRLFFIVYWDPIYAGRSIDVIVERYEAEINNSRKVLDTIANYMMYAGTLVACIAMLLFFFFNCGIESRKPS